MKKSFLLIPALALLSCGGGSGNQSQNADSTSIDGRDAINRVSTVPPDVNKQIWDLLVSKSNSEIMFDDSEFENYKTDDGVNVQMEGMELSDYFAYKFFPLKDGSVKVYVLESDFFWHGDGEDRFSFNSYIFKDGKLEPTPLEPDLKKIVDKAFYADDKRNLFCDKGILFGYSKIFFAWDGEKMVRSKSEEQIKYEQQPPYDVVNTYGQYVDTLKPILIVMSDEGYQSLQEYARYDGRGRIVEYGCITGQFDYEGYVRMFKLFYNGDKIDSIQWKEVYSGAADKQIDNIFKKGVSVYDCITGDEIGYSRPTDTQITDLDPTSIKSMRKYADSKNDILCREFGRIYDFSEIKWDKQQRDNDGRLISSEFKQTSGQEYDSYKIKYTNKLDQTIMKITRKFRQEEEEGGFFENEFSYTLTQKYLNTDVNPE